MKGRLTDQPLAELIREIISKGLSGTLRLEHERAQAAVYFENGQVVFAASNIRTLRLREYLVKRDLVSEKEFENLGNLSDLALAKALRANGTLRPEDIQTVLTTLVMDTLRVALLWTEGNWDFNERARLDDPVRVSLDTNSLLREAARRLPEKFVSLRFRNPAETISRAADVSGTLLPSESSMLSRLDTPTNVEHLVTVRGLVELDSYRILYGLTLSGLVTREYWQNAFRTEATTSSKAPTVARVAPPTPQPESEATTTAEDQLQPFFDRLTEATNYYQVLDLPVDAGPSEVKDAYYALARRYHPDRFHLKSGTPIHVQLSSCFARVTQAYETLMDRKARSTYDLSLERSRKLADSAPKTAEVKSVPDATDELEFDGGSSQVDQAEHNFKEGFDALKQGRINAAAAHLAAAARLEPKDARYRAYYGRALAATEKTRRLAENEIQAALGLDPGNATYRTMLAELYFDLKFHRRAQTELDRALALDPSNGSAQSLLRKLEKARQSSVK
jgi:hypothetical protein